MSVREARDSLQHACAVFVGFFHAQSDFGLPAGVVFSDAIVSDLP
jgi:hypothetical protein